MPLSDSYSGSRSAEANDSSQPSKSIEYHGLANPIVEQLFSDIGQDSPTLKAPSSPTNGSYDTLTGPSLRSTPDHRDLWALRNDYMTAVEALFNHKFQDESKQYSPEEDNGWLGARILDETEYRWTISDINSPEKVHCHNKLQVAKSNDPDFILYDSVISSKLLQSGGNPISEPGLPHSAARHLKLNDALLLPSTSVYDQLIKTYFQWVHPFIPVLDRDAFMVQNDGFPNLPISPLLIQAMLLAASRFNPLVHLHNNEQASFRFYEKFETLYNANYEADSIIVVQATALVAWHCGFSKETYAKSQYWITAASNVAFRCAKGNFYNPVLDTITIRLWRRIWWGLFIQDRTIALVANTPVSARIHAEELDELTENDFYERSSHLSDEDFPSLASFFLDYVELCKIMDRIIVARDLPTTSPKSSETRRFLSFTLRGWLVRFKKAQSSGPNVSGVGRAFLHATFNTLTYEVHSCTLTPVRRDFALVKTKHLPDEIIRTAAECITTTARSLLEMKKLSYCPGLIAHSLCCAIAAHIYRLETLAGGVSEVSTRQNLTFCVEAWGYLAKSWNVNYSAQINNSLAMPVKIEGDS